MKYVLALFIAFASINAQAGQDANDQANLQDNTWEVSYSNEPAMPVRNTIRIKFTGGKIHFAQTCHFSDLNQGEDVEVAVSSDIVSINPFTYDVATDERGSVTNSIGKVCSVFLDKGPKPYVITWSRREVAMFRRMFHRK